MIGETVHHYRILDRLGAGGMGEVYRARDERLGREVAIKALPEELSADPDRLRRLEAEARAMAAVDHPNVATIHSVEEHEGRVLLVLELVEGETLAERLEQGPLQLEETLELARQVAAGLEAAHAQGIMHRDLKPGNVMVGPKGQVKILDFGLAKALEPPEAIEQDLTRSPTLTMEAATQRGMILGTAPYLSPEQARGQVVDERTDVWAFGCLIYEMLTGRRAFGGETVTDTIAAVVTREPDWEALPRETPGIVRWLLRRCLDKDPDERLHAIADARMLLEALEEVQAGEAVTPELRRPRSMAPWLVAVALALLVGASLGWLMSLKPEPGAAVPSVVRFSLFADPDDSKVSFYGQLSPDDRLFAYRRRSRPGAPLSSIHLRSMEDGSIRELTGSERAYQEVFSPDGEQIAFFDGDAVQRVDLRHGTLDTIVQLPFKPSNGTMLTWLDEGPLVISNASPRGLWRLDPSNRALEELTLADPSILEAGSAEFAIFPKDVPGDRFLLLTLRSGSGNRHHIEVLSLDSGERWAVTEVGNNGQFVPPGFLAYFRQGKVFAVPFDPSGGTAEGEPMAVLEGVRPNQFGIGMFSVSGSGSLVYVPGEEVAGPAWRLAVARPGEPPEEIPFDLRAGPSPRVSPDGTRVTVASSEGSGAVDLWIFDLERRTSRRLTDEAGNEWWHAWRSDGLLAFQSDREEGNLDLYLMDPDRPGSTEKVLDGGSCDLQPQTWAPDGRLLYQRRCPDPESLDIFTFDPKSGEPRPLRENPAREKHPSVSPDGRWLLFASDLSGRDQVYLTTYPEPGRLIQVSPAGGDGPIWDPSGEGLYFHSERNLLYVPFDGAAENPLGASEIAVEGIPENLDWGRNYDLFPDGRILLRWSASASIRELRVVLNWNREVAEKLESPLAE